MNCLACAREIPDPISDSPTGLVESAGRKFRCPVCDALHIRRVSGHTREGLPVFEYRLWGHPVTTRRKVVPPPGHPRTPIAV